MKNLMIILFLTCIAFAQDNQTELMCLSIDDFDDTETLLGGSTILYKDGGDLSTEGLIFMTTLNKKKGKVSLRTLMVIAYGLESNCVGEDSTLDIILENGEKIKLTNWNDFNCKGTNYFTLSSKDVSKISQSKMKAVRYTEKRSFEKMTVKNELSEENSAFLQNTIIEINGVNAGNLSIAECDE